MWRNRLSNESFLLWRRIHNWGEKMKKQDLTGRKFGLLKVLDEAEKQNGRIAWRCRCTCGNEVVVKAVYLNSGDTTSCGCYKRMLNDKHLRDDYNASRVQGVVLPLFKDERPRKDSATGYRGVSKYVTRVSKEVRYRAWITVAGKRHYKSGFMTAEDAYYNGRLKLEDEHLPKRE